MSTIKCLKVIDHMVGFVDYVSMPETLHKLSPEILRRIFEGLKKLSESKTHEDIAEYCNTSPETITRFLNKKRGANPERFTLNMALKLWQGLGHPPETLIADCNVDHLLAVKIRRIQASDYRELFDLLVDVLNDYDYADPGQLAVIKGALEAVRATVLARKSQPPEEPGGKLSNYAAAD